MPKVPIRGRDRVPMQFLIDPDIRRALRQKKATDEVDMSDVVNESIRKALRLPAQAVQSQS